MPVNPHPDARIQIKLSEKQTEGLAEVIATAPQLDAAKVPVIDVALPGVGSESAGEEPNVWSVRDQKRRRLIRIIAIVAVLIVFAALVVLCVQYFRAPTDEAEVAIDPAVSFGLACDELASNPELTTLQVRDFEINDQLIGKIKPLTNIETFLVDRGSLTDQSMETIAALPKLRQLRLRLSPITDDGLAKLVECETLQFLNLPHAECGIAGIEKLRDLPNLRQLRLGSKKLTGDVANPISKISKLRTLHLIGIPITDEGLKKLAAMPLLESLYLDDSAVTEAGWDWLFKHEAHLHVHINQKHHDRDPGRHEHR